MDSFDIITIQEYLKRYNKWDSQIQRTEEGESYLYSPFVSSNDLLVFILYKLDGDFLMVTTVDFIKPLKDDAYKEILLANDKVKLVKFFQTDSEEFVELGFEIIKETFSYELFEVYMDMLSVTLEQIMTATKEIPNVSIDHLKTVDEDGKIS